MATLAVVVFRLSPQDIVGFRIRMLTHIVASYVIGDLIINTYRDKHRSRKFTQDKLGIATDLYHFGLCPRVPANMGVTSLEMQIIPSMERIARVLDGKNRRFLSKHS